MPATRPAAARYCLGVSRGPIQRFAANPASINLAVRDLRMSSPDRHGHPARQRVAAAAIEARGEKWPHCDHGLWTGQRHYYRVAAYQSPATGELTFRHFNEIYLQLPMIKGGRFGDGRE